MIIKSEQEMLEAGKNYAKSITAPAVIELLGDVGAGKTTFTRGLAAGLGVIDPITSPSFTISKTYALPKGGHFIHYDFYRLKDPGIMLDDLSENLRSSQNIIIVEWGNSITNILPPNRTIIKIKYQDDNSREVVL